MAIDVGDELIRRFAEKMVANHLRPQVLDRAKGKVFILATAAPGVYARKIGEIVGADYVVATERGCNENKGQEKMNSVREVLATEDLQLVEVITDHPDDLPLMLCSEQHRNVLINPSQRMLSDLEREGVKSIEIIRD